ncbi:MAG TPA: DUF6289 family protein [Pyrinomonadaceae bacterium]
MHVSAKRLLRRSPLWLAIATLMLAVSPAFSPAPSAKTSNACLWYKSYTYYSDATYTTQVGMRVHYCDGEKGGAGTVTQYYTVKDCECLEEGGK